MKAETTFAVPILHGMNDYTLLCYNFCLLVARFVHLFPLLSWALLVWLYPGKLYREA